MSDTAKLTKAQESILAYLECVRSHMFACEIGRGSIRPLRRLEELGLASRNLHEQWYITALGRKWLARRGEEL